MEKPAAKELIDTITRSLKLIAQGLSKIGLTYPYEMEIKQHDIERSNGWSNLYYADSDDNDLHTLD